MAGNGCVQAFNALKHQFDRSLHPFGSKHLGDFAIDIFYRERRINGTHMISRQRFALALPIRFGDKTVHTSLRYQSHGCPKCTQLLQTRHIDAVVVGVANLWRTRHHHNLLGMQSVEYFEDALLQCGATHDAVVDDDKIVFVWPQRTIGDVIHV